MIEYLLLFTLSLTTCNVRLSKCLDFHTKSCSQSSLRSSVNHPINGIMLFYFVSLFSAGAEFQTWSLSLFFRWVWEYHLWFCICSTESKTFQFCSNYFRGFWPSKLIYENLRLICPYPDSCLLPFVISAQHAHHPFFLRPIEFYGSVFVFLSIWHRLIFFAY